jgi:dTDP-4-dehydrorhamnose reductase
MAVQHQGTATMTTQPDILLLGAAGQVGFELHRALQALGTVTPATRDGTLPGGQSCRRADLADAPALTALVHELKPSIIVNAAAYTAVDKAESERELVFRINAEAPGVLAQAATEVGALLVHYSTDYVFDGSSTRPWREDDAVGPLGVYGESKLAGEREVSGSPGAHMVLRTAWVYAARGHNFLKTMLKLGADRDRLRVVDDQHGAPTSARLIAATTLHCLNRWLFANAQDRARMQGVFHLAAASSTTWYGYARAIFEGAVRAGILERAPRIEAIASSDYPTPARRPAHSVLDTAKLAETFSIHLPDWRVGLDLTLSELATR